MPPATIVDIFADDTTLSASAPSTDTSGLCAELCKSTGDLENWSNNNRFKLHTKNNQIHGCNGQQITVKDRQYERRDGDQD